jgi:hypothetical protein
MDDREELIENEYEQEGKEILSELREEFDKAGEHFDAIRKLKKEIIHN